VDDVSGFRRRFVAGFVFAGVQIYFFLTLLADDRRHLPQKLNDLPVINLTVMLRVKKSRLTFNVNIIIYNDCISARNTLGYQNSTEAQQAK